MNKNVPAYILFPILGSIGGMIVFLIPFIGPLFFLPMMPFASVYDYLIPGNFQETGQHVEVGFAWIILKTQQAWIFYFSLFFLVGLIVGVLKHITRGKILLFLVSYGIVFCVALLLQMLIFQHEYKQELIEFTSSTESIFACDEYSSLELEADGSLWKFQQDGSMRVTSLEGNVDFESNTYSPEFQYGQNEYTNKLLEQHQKDLSTCRNSNGDTISDLYIIEPIKNFLDESKQ